MKTKNDYANDMRIDDSALDEEWLAQPSLMIKYTGIQATARLQLDLAKENLLIVRADLDKVIRNNPDKYGLDKVTNETVQNSILLQKKYKKASVAVIEAQYEYSMSNGAVNACEQKKSALENMGRLLGLNYFSGPKIPRDLNSIMSRKAQDKKMNKKIKMNRK